MAQVKKEREQENLLNEQNGNPGDVDFQRMIKQFREQEHQEQPHMTKSDMQITICVRKRPVNKKEVKEKDYDCITCWHPKVIIHDCKLKVDGITKYLDSNAFEFDHSFDENTSNETVYEFTAKPLIHFVFHECGRATVFAYGQTGSGKTHTMEGIQRQAAADIFAEIKKFKQTDKPLELWLSFFEIYGGYCQDLLRQKRLTIREDGNGEVQIVDLDEIIINNEEDLLQTMQRGNAMRTTHATEKNDQSSRSHSICQLNIREKGTMKQHGKLSLIDLAGSERGADTKSHNRQRRMESSEINKSLLALKECFRALDSGGRGTHIPFRASKLTQVLKDSFVNAKARTVMIAAVSPCASSADHTINTLRYADRVKEKQVSDDIADPVQVKVKLGGDGEENHSLEDLHGVVQTLYEEQENLLSSHMDAIQENADLLTEEGVLLSEVQGDSVVDYDIDQYASRLDEILAQKEKTIKRLRKQLAQFRQRCVEEENASKKVDQVSYY
ncbi:unnamed protein product [Aphanomyces euteiches]